MSDQQTVPDYRQDALNLIKEHVSRQGVENHPISEMAPTYSDEDFFRAAELEGKEFRPMEVEPAAPKEKSFDSDLPGLREASSELQQKRRAAERPVTLREYRSIDKDGTFGDKRPPHETRTAADAADDLTKLRQAERSAEADFENMSLRGRIDHFRAQADAADRGGATPTQPADLQPQPEAQPDVPPGVDPEVAKALSNEKVRAAINEQIRESEVARQNYTAATQQLAQTQIATLLQSFPELQGVNAQTYPAAMRAIQARDPARAQQIEAHLQSTTRSLQTIAQHYQAEQHHAALQEVQRFQRHAQIEDGKFEAFEKTRPAAEVKAVRENIATVLQQEFGIDPQALHQLYNSNPALRSVEAQKLIYMAIRAALAQRGIKKAPAKLPPVQRPGVDSGYRETYEGGQLREAMAAFSRESSPRNAAKALVAKRRAALR